MQKMGGIFFDSEEQNRHLQSGLIRRQKYLEQTILDLKTRDLDSFGKGYLAALRKVYSIVKEEIKKIPVGAVTGRMGAKRKEIRDKYSFDTKFASHAIRSMKMVVEFLNDPARGLIVDRTGIDADELIAIRTGKVTAESVKAEADRLFQLAERALKTTSLPELLNIEAIERLTVSILRVRFELSKEESVG